MQEPVGVAGLVIAIIALILAIILFVLWNNASNELKKLENDYGLNDSVVVTTDATYVLRKPQTGGKSLIIYNGRNGDLAIGTVPGVTIVGSSTVSPGQAAIFKWNSDGTTATRVSTGANSTMLGTAGAALATSSEFDWLNATSDLPLPSDYATYKDLKSIPYFKGNYDLVPRDKFVYDFENAEKSDGKITITIVKPTGQTVTGQKFALFYLPPVGLTTESIEIKGGDGVTIKGSSLLSRNGSIGFTWLNETTLQSDVGTTASVPTSALDKPPAEIFA